jgi:hypothetical protein
MLVSKQKRYLSGSDWVINTLDYMMKAATCAGNMSQVVLELDGLLDESEVRSRLNAFVKQFPVLQGHVSRDIKLAPYWKIPGKSGRDVSLTVRNAETLVSGESAFAHFEKSANAPFQDDNEHLAFHLFKDRGRCLLAMAFDHRIFDARGAEMFLNLFQRSVKSGSSTVSGDIAFTSSSALTQWSRKFLAGRTVNRRIIGLSKLSPRALPVPQDGTGRQRYHLLSFTEQETAAIYDRAYTEAGYLMESPYLLSVIIQCVHELCATKQVTGSCYLIPVTMDLRPGRDPLQEIFFNYVSYLFYQIPVHEADDRKGLISVLKQQMYDQVKSGFPKDLAEASLLTRIAPLPVLGKLLHLPMKGKMATFAFSHLGKSSYQQPLFMDAKVTNIFHMPRVPVPPGLGFFSNYCSNKLNVVISSLDGVLSSDEVLMLDKGIRKRFGVGSGT